MNIISAEFIKGVVKADAIFENSIPQIAFIGRSNVGKSTVINTLTKNKDLAKTSSYPGRTQQINVFFINQAFYLVDLPGYGFTKTSKSVRENIQRLINWYLLESGYETKQIVHIIDANIGPTEADLEMLSNLEHAGKSIIVLANKVDKIKSSEYVKKMRAIKEQLGHHTLIPFSSVKRIGLAELYKAIA